MESSVAGSAKSLAELAHVLAPNLRDDPGEDFADSLASALLYPRHAAEAGYRKVKRRNGNDRRVEPREGCAGETPTVGRAAAADHHRETADVGDVAAQPRQCIEIIKALSAADASGEECGQLRRGGSPRVYPRG